MTVSVFDTTLRDGEQTPGVSLNNEEKLEIAFQLERLGVDVIEAGFPVSSRGDFEAVKKVSEEVKGLEVAGLARSNEKDVKRAWDALKYAESPRIHVFIATSDVHMKNKLNKSKREVIESAVSSVSQASEYTDNIEFSAEDAFRSSEGFLYELYEEVIDAGATTINIPDTVGYATPSEVSNLVVQVKENVPNIDGVNISVHCHDDLGMATINSLEAIEAGADQFEGSINGIGERAGNAAIEEIALSLETRQDFFDEVTDLNLRHIARTSRMVSNLTGVPIQPNKAIVGDNAFAHESGIHQDGVIKERTTYEIMDAEKIGISKENIVLGKHSGRNAFSKKLEEMGYELDGEELNSAFKRFKDLADKKQDITQLDIEAIMEDEISQSFEKYNLEILQISSNSDLSTATIRMSKGEERKNESSCSKSGPIDAVYKAINKVLGIDCNLTDFQIDSVTEGKDALGEVIVKLKNGKDLYIGRGVSTNIIEASAKAYNTALNRIIEDKELEVKI